jgi:NitT/TauT family transport system substrate-binding protein
MKEGTKRHPRLRALVALLAVLAIVAAACGGDDTTETTPPGDGTTVAGDGAPMVDLSGTSIRVTLPPAEPLNTGLVWMVDLLEEWGAEVERVYPTTTTGIQAVVAGQADISTQGADEVIIGVAEGVDVVGVGVLRAAMDYVLTSKLEIESLDDLVGKTIGVSGPGGFDALLTRLTLSEAGIEESDVNFVQIGNSGDRAAAIIADRIEAANLFLSTWIGLSNETDEVHAIAFMSDALPTLPKDLFFANASFWEENPDVGLAAACVNLEGNKWFAENQDEWIEYSKELNPGVTDEELIELHAVVTEMNMFPVEPDEMLVAEGLQQLADAMLENGDITQAVDASTLIDRSFLDEAKAMGCGG